MKRSLSIGAICAIAGCQSTGAAIAEPVSSKEGVTAPVTPVAPVASATAISTESKLPVVPGVVGTKDRGAPATVDEVACKPNADFPKSVPVSEASAAAEIDLDGARVLLVVADSGNEGAAVLIPTDGRPTRRLSLPLDPSVSDDIEGLAWHDEAVWTLTSAGAVTRFTPRGTTLTRAGAAYRIGPRPFSCDDLTSRNCEKNWEGLCLRRTPTASKCVGYAASKSEGALYCVVIDEGKLAIDEGAAPIKLALPSDALSDCAFGPNKLIVTTNDSNDSTSYIVDETNGHLTALPVKGLGSNEAIAVGADGSLYQFEDSFWLSFLPFSASSRATCTGL